MTINEIKRANAAAGFYFFEADTLRFFASIIHDAVYEGPGGIYFVTSERFETRDYKGPRKYTVRRYVPETAEVQEASKFQRYEESEDAHDDARALARTGTAPTPRAAP